MVRLSAVQLCRLAAKIRSKASTTQTEPQRPFVDSFKLVAQAGRGGSGLPRFGGPGGKGGDVYVVGNQKLKDLRTVKDSGQTMVHAGHGEGQPAV